MIPLRPRRLTHAGSIEAIGFLLDIELAGAQETRRRILELWEPGVQTYRIENDCSYYVRLPAPRRADSRQSPGAPLALMGNIASAVPLSNDELSALNAPPDAVVLARGSRVFVETLDSSKLETPEDWLDLGGFEPFEVESLGLTYERPRVVAEPEHFDARTKLGDVPQAAPELLETLAALKEKKGTGANKTKVSVGSGTSGFSMTEARSRLFGFLRTLRDAGHGLFGSGAGVRDEAVDTRAPRGGFSGAWRRFAARVLNTTRLASLLGRRQAEYVARMMEMFKDGNLDEALRHAIPINDFPSSLNSTPAFGVPQPRTSLRIVPEQKRSSTSIGMGIDMLSYMRRLYRNAFDRLVAQGRFEEAAFILAELLRNNEEAVAFLERHGKFGLAAELAEARKLPPGLVVRQWFLAGDRERAIRVARRTGAFGDAVTRLEKSDREKAEQLRIIWAETLAEAGSYAAAVDVIWPVASVREMARGWMDKTIEMGGPSGARMLARKVSLVPEEFADVRERARLFLEDESLEGLDSRLSFAETLCQGAPSAGAQTLARAAARALLRDAGQESRPMPPDKFKALVDFSGDRALCADMPPFSIIPAEAGKRAQDSLRLEVSAIDCGSMPLKDACLLDNGRLLVALGEAGVKLLTRDGRTVTHFDQPATRLVMSDHGDRALLLAQRGEVWRLARLDLLARRAEDWCEARLDAFAPDYDGTLWYLGAGGDFYAVDATAKNFDALWRVPEAGQRVVGVVRSSSTCRFLTASSNGLEKWVYQLPLLTLRTRTPISIATPGSMCVSLQVALSLGANFVDQSLYYAIDKNYSSDESVKIASVSEPLPELRLRQFDYEVVKRAYVIGDGNSIPGQPEVNHRFAVSPVYNQDGARVRLFDLEAGRLRTEIMLAGAGHVSTRLTEKSLSIADDRGRVLVLDLQRNCLIRNLRI